MIVNIFGGRSSRTASKGAEVLDKIMSRCAKSEHRLGNALELLAVVEIGGGFMQGGGRVSWDMEKARREEMERLAISVLATDEYKRILDRTSKRIAKRAEQMRNRRDK